MIDQDAITSDDNVVHFRVFVLSTARKFYRSIPEGQVDLEDLVSECWAALIASLPRYDATRGTVANFLIPRLRGAMQDYLRGFDPLSRSQRKLIRSIDTARISLSFLFDREPTRSEIASEVGIELPVLDTALLDQASAWTDTLDVRSPDGYAISDFIKDPAAEDPFFSIMDGERSQLLRSLLDMLPKNQRFILISRYFLQIRLSDAARVLGVTESRASQLHTQGLESLRALVGEFVADPTDLLKTEK